MQIVDETTDQHPSSPCRTPRARRPPRWFLRVARDERGLSTVEYVILLALIAVVGIGVWQSFGQTLIGKVNQANTTFQTLGE
jgi:Flp pilus assembly pilin Flp